MNLDTLKTFLTTTAGELAIKIAGAILFYILLSDFLGFIITGLIILLVLGLRFGLKPLHAVLLAVATTLGMHFVFVDFLLVQLPWGLLETVVFGS